jgi:hypothetical protein
VSVAVNHHQTAVAVARVEVLVEVEVVEAAAAQDTGNINININPVTHSTFQPRHFIFLLSSILRAQNSLKII